MKDYTNDTPEFSEILKILETTDPGHADILNPSFIDIFQNTLVNRKAIQELGTDSEELNNALEEQEAAINNFIQQSNTNFSNIQTEFNNKQTQINTLQSDILTFKNISLTTSSFTSNTDADYPYKAQITCTGVTVNHVPFVVFDKDSAATGIFAPYAETTAGKVIIYAAKPATCTIESIVCTRG